MASEQTPAPHRESAPLCEGDTKVVYDILPADLAADIFQRVKDEVEWLHMSHQGGDVPRLVAVQGSVEPDGTEPIYRHPADESPPLHPWTPAVGQIRDVVEKAVGHPLNHALIQLYRGGSDYISEHSDKTLDIDRESAIVNVSLGAERTMVFRTKRQDKDKYRDKDTSASSESPRPETAPPATTPDQTHEGPKRQVQRARLSHNSMCVMGLATNRRWLHGIRQDKRLDRDKFDTELAYGGERISLTFRRIATFMNSSDTVATPSGGRQALIWGQGATAKTRARARPVVNGEAEAVRMLQAFGRENHAGDFDWEAYYGAGFDVLDINTSPRFFVSGDTTANMAVQIMLAECGVGYARGMMGPVKKTERGRLRLRELPIKFVDNDQAKTMLEDVLAILAYIWEVYGGGRRGEKSPGEASPAGRAREVSSLVDAYHLLEMLRSGYLEEQGKLTQLRAELEWWNDRMGSTQRPVTDGAEHVMTLADYVLWPALHEIMSDDVHQELCDGLFYLKAYYERIGEREAVLKVLKMSGHETWQAATGGEKTTS